MNIIMMTDVYKPVVNGVSVSVEYTTHELKKLAHEVTVVSPSHHEKELTKDVVRLLSFRYPFYPEQRVAIPFPFKKIKNILKKEIDIVHMHSLFSLGALGLWIAKKKNAVKVFTYHTFVEKYIDYVPLPAKFVKWVAVLASRKFCNACDAIIVPSKETKSILLSYGVYKPIYVLSNPIAETAFLGVSKESPYLQQLKFPSDVKICLYVGRISIEKNLEFLIESFKYVSQSVEQARLVLIGEGPYRKKIESLIKKLALTSKVFMLGLIPRNELDKWFTYAHVFLFTSMSETQGLALCEAFHFGLPAVIVDGPAIRERVKNGINGYITPANQKLFAEKVIAILSNEELRVIFSENTKLSLADVTEEIFIQSILKIYQSLLLQNKARQSIVPNVLEGGSANDE